MAFGPESTNPRERRAYAHAMIQKGIDGGKPEDKLEAVRVANKASLTEKGKGMGHQAVRAAINQDPYFPKDVTQKSVMTRSDMRYWTNPEFVDRYKAVTEAVGRTGTEITKPETGEEYLSAAHQVNNSVGLGESVENNARSSQARGDSMIQQDFTVPGTYYEHRAAQALAYDSSRKQ